MSAPEIRGDATAEEVAAVLAAISVRVGGGSDASRGSGDPYVRWRAIRRAALRRPRAGSLR
jgi:Acyl-CoA carboxylase epsilon subunit